VLSSLGRGISLRRSFLGEFSERLVRGDPKLVSSLDWVELVPENFMGRGGKIRRALSPILEAVPVSFHSVSLSIGSVDPLNWEFLSQLREFARNAGVRWVTDHLSYSSVNGVQLNDLLPLPFTKNAVHYVAERIRQVQDYLGVPFGLENPSYYKVMPGAEMPEAEFLSEVLRLSDCRLLLDVNNVYVNCFNHSEDPQRAARRYLREIPLDRITEVHVAGHKPIELGGQIKLLDTHGASVSEPVLGLLRELHQLLPVKTLLLERESQVPPLDSILEEVSGIWEDLVYSPQHYNTHLPQEARI